VAHLAGGSQYRLDGILKCRLAVERQTRYDSGDRTCWFEKHPINIVAKKMPKGYQ
jgi:hypothetical protein